MCARKGEKHTTFRAPVRLRALLVHVFFGRENCVGGVEEGTAVRSFDKGTRESPLPLALRDLTQPTSVSLHHGCYPFGREREGSCSRHPPQLFFSVPLTSFPSHVPFFFFTSLPFLYRVAAAHTHTHAHARAREKRKLRTRWGSSVTSRGAYSSLTPPHSHTHTHARVPSPPSSSLTRHRPRRSCTHQ